MNEVLTAPPPPPVRNVSLADLLSPPYSQPARSQWGSHTASLCLSCPAPETQVIRDLPAELLRAVADREHSVAVVVRIIRT